MIGRGYIGHVQGIVSGEDQLIEADGQPKLVMKKGQPSVNGKRHVFTSMAIKNFDRGKSNYDLGVESREVIVRNENYISGEVI